VTDTPVKLMRAKNMRDVKLRVGWHISERGCLRRTHRRLHFLNCCELAAGSWP